MKMRIIFCCVGLLLEAGVLFAQKPSQGFFEVRIYRLKDKTQEERVDAFLKDSYLPALHSAGIKSVGVFKPVETDTTFGKRIFLLVPYNNLDQFTQASDLLAGNTVSGSKDYIDADYTNPPYVRLESILLRAFPGMPRMETPNHSSPRSERIYELRSYEGPTEKIYRSKVKMFNTGDEIGLFKRLGFNAVFYADVIAGGRMPNLMYMTTFASQASHDEKWAAFREDPQWKQLVSMPEYQHNVSKINIFLLRPTAYSDY
jgi:hypothetical protein